MGLCGTAAQLSTKAQTDLNPSAICEDYLHVSYPASCGGSTNVQCFVRVVSASASVLGTFVDSEILAAVISQPNAGCGPTGHRIERLNQAARNQICYPSLVPELEPRIEGQPANSKRSDGNAKFLL
jgi:hypothetical protein